MDESHSNAPLARPLKATCPESTQHKLQRRIVLGFWLLSAILLGLLLMACATPQPLPCEPLASPLMPAIQTPPPKQSYLLSAQTEISTWQLRLKATTPTPKP